MSLLNAEFRSFFRCFIFEESFDFKPVTQNDVNGSSADDASTSDCLALFKSKLEAGRLVNVTSGICRERSRLKEKESKRETLKRLQV